MNDNERREWVMNDEGLYNLWRSERPRKPIRKWIRDNRSMITEAVENMTSGKRRPHYLEYERLGRIGYNARP